MRGLLFVPLAALVWMVTLADADPTPYPTSIPTPSTPIPTPVPTPVPAHGIVDLSAAAGPAGSQLTVTGSQFEPGEPIVLFLDTPDHQLGATVADQQGDFTQSVTIPGDAVQGSHIICVQQQPQPRCAQLLVQAPLPSSTPTPIATPTPTATPTAIASPTVVPAARGRPGILAGFLSSPLGLGIILVLVTALVAAVVWVVRSRRGVSPQVSPYPRGYGRPLGPGQPGAWPPGRPDGPIPPPGAARPGGARVGPGPWGPGVPGQAPPPTPPGRGRQLPGQPGAPGTRPPGGPLPPPRGWQPTRPGGPPPGWTPGAPLPPRRPPEEAGPAPWGPAGPRRPTPRGAPPGPVPPRGPILEGEAIPLPPPSERAEPKSGPAPSPGPEAEEEEPPADRG